MSPRALWIALALSLVVNVFVLGAGAGLFFGRTFAPHPGPGSRPNPLMAAAERLDPTDRDVFKALMQDEAQRQGPTLLDARMQRRQAVVLMRAPSFDRAAAGAALDRARADDVQVREKLETTMLDFAAKLDAPNRAILSEGLARGPVLRWMQDHHSMAPASPAPQNSAGPHS
ncbi:MAG TPA: periplasmic heavy metal sensor [Caulobacteraceae bacterium]|jgi:uncharacterized membrane protein